MTVTPLFDGVPNSRGVDGLPLASGGRTHAGVLYRSAALDTISDRGIATLRQLEVRAVVDLRSEAERERSPHRLPPNAGIDLIEAPITVSSLDPRELTELEEELAARPKVPPLAEAYRAMLSQAGEQFALAASVVARVSRTGGAVLVHCTAGKDRTGITAALLLELAGTDRQAVVANYCESERYLAGAWVQMMLDRLSREGMPVDDSVIRLVSTTPPDAIESALSWVDEHSGTAAQYLVESGLSGADVDQLRRVLG